MQNRLVNSFVSIMNLFPLKLWILIYFIIIVIHSLFISLGNPFNSFGFLVCLTPYFILLSKTRLWSHNTFLKGLLMFLIFIVISILNSTTNYIQFYEFYFLLGLYGLTQVIMYLQLKIKDQSILDYKSLKLVINLFCVILFCVGLYFVPLGGYGIYLKLRSEDIVGLVYPLYFIAVLITVCCVLFANTFISLEKENDNVKIYPQDKIDINTINCFFQESELYLNYNFSIDNLAHQTKLEKKRLSYLINSCMDTNYYRLVAFHRISKAQKILEKSEYTLEYVAMQCGFTSTSVFLKHFKTFVGTTPKKYRDNITEID